MILLLILVRLRSLSIDHRLYMYTSIHRYAIFTKLGLGLVSEAHFVGDKNVM
jgi:hypothetical protein